MLFFLMMNPFHNRRPVLIVEDRWEDTFLLQRLIRSTKLEYPVQTSSGANQAIEWLRVCVNQGDPKPFLILLDIGSPLSNGFDVLEFVSENDEIKGIDVVMLAASDDPAARQRAQELGASGYLLKFPSTQTLAEVIQQAAQRVSSPRQAVEFRSQTS